jgi:hypothetical protein
MIPKEMLAAAKIAHEFGHVNHTASTEAALYERQNRLMPIYNTIFMENGHNTQDVQLLDLARQIGGTPVEISAERERRAEANVISYLRERIFARNAKRQSLNQFGAVELPDR